MSASEPIELKPCPFCGGAVEIYRGGFLRIVACPQCGCRVSFEPISLAEKYPKELVAAAWNRRASNA